MTWPMDGPWTSRVVREIGYEGHELGALGAVAVVAQHVDGAEGCSARNARPEAKGLATPTSTSATTMGRTCVEIRHRRHRRA